MVLVNGPVSAMGREHIILWGRGREQYRVANFPGPLSIKSVVRGEAEWTTSSGRFRLDRSSVLVLNRGQRYTISIEPGHGAVETLCVFFRDGYVDAALGDLDSTPQPPGYLERPHRREGRIAAQLVRLHTGLQENAGPGWLEDRILDIALAMSSLQEAAKVEHQRVPAIKAATREEIYRRLNRGRAALDAMSSQAVRLDDAAREACLSPFHFHRLFKEVFRETPHEYGLRRRLERAARLLQETRLPVTQICLDTGFSSLGSFSTLFRRRFGVSPREIRKNEEVFLTPPGPR
jgi:AraC family transcriptional regulator